MRLEQERLLEMDNSRIEERIDEIVERLSCPLAKVDFDEGWTTEAQEGTLALLGRLKNDIGNGVDVSEKPEYRSMLRGLDHWGIESGAVMESIGELSQVIRSAKA